MAKGVKKTYQRAYFKILMQVLDVILNNRNIITEYIEEIKIELNDTIPSIKYNAYVDNTVKKILSKYIEDNITVLNILEKVKKYTFEYTENETMQAMESLIHNLNTMHSRAGAQI